MKVFLYCLIPILLFYCSSHADQPSKRTESKTDNVVNAEEVLSSLAKRAISDISKIEFDSTKIPRTVEGGKLKGTPSKSWTSGFYPGLLWQLYDFTNEAALKNAAIKWSMVVEKEKMDNGTHDLGFKIYCPFGNAYKITKEEKYKEVFLSAASTLSTRYNQNVAAIRSWDFNKDVWQYPVIIDNMMNLEMLFEATKLTGDSSFHYIANQHASTTLKNHFRKDNSSYHVVDYNPNTGEVNNKHTHQGFNHESAWSRGQAWGLYGFTVAYRYTNDKKYLQQARKIADFIFTNENLPSDMVPYWDYNAPNIPDEPRDVSAAAITASGLYELATHDTSSADKYHNWANKILQSLSSKKYKCSTPPFFLQHSVGSVPGEFEVDAPIIYADYYYVEALLRQSKI